MNRAAAIIAALLAGLVLCGETLKAPDGKPVRYAGKFSSAKVEIPKSVRRDFRFRAAWVATVENIDFGPFGSPREFMKAFVELVETMKKENLNVLIFQVRSNNDAWYQSKINPYSKYMFGQEFGGAVPGFDSLGFMVRECHRRGIEFHAWLNPYRVTGSTQYSKKKYLSTLSPKNFARQHPEAVISSPAEKKGTALTLDPGNPRVRNHIRRTIAEILRYNVDAIHFDDYFYPYGGFGDADQQSFKTFNKSNMSLDDWRRDNVTKLISLVSADIRAHNAKYKRKVAFGISPFGIWANAKDIKGGSPTGGKSCYGNLYADVRLWIQRGYIDYVIPQLYWGFAHEIASYAALSDWWTAQVRGTKVKLYIGHAIYMLGSNATFPVDELYNQLRYDSKHPEIGGFSFYSFRKYASPENKAQKAGVNRVKPVVRTMGAGKTPTPAAKPTKRR